MKILVGLSGGVDSSVALMLLKEQGAELLGATMSLWQPGKYSGGIRDACFGPGEEDDIACARKLCADHGIPYRVFDCSAEYEKTILADFRREYLAGRTPNPCIRCNAQMKFGLLPMLARRAGVDFDFFATGHYARIDRSGERPKLLKGRDANKDQSYFLYRLSREQLEKVMFPLGELTKPEVRKMAAKFGLAVSDKPDSQDFYSGDPEELLEVAPQPGNIVDVSGKILGTHSGYWRYTIGQRRGLGVAAKTPLYVTNINACRNEITVADHCPRHHGLAADSVVWHGEFPAEALEAEVKVRSVQKAAAARVIPQSDGSIKAEIPDGIFAIAPGQSAVFYRGDEVLGGGIISEAWE